MAKHPKRPRDPNQLGKLIVDLSTGEASESAISLETPGTEFARKGGLKGGKARAAALTKKRKVEIARIAAVARWGAPRKKRKT